MTEKRWDSDDYLVVDVEGNGASPPELVELAVVPIVGGEIGNPVAWLVKPSRPISWIARNVHGISNADVADLPGFGAVASDVTEHLDSGAVIVGHAVHIDLSVLHRSIPGWRPDRILDTLRLARAVLPDLASHRLGTLVEHFDLAVDRPAGRPHRAAYDAVLTARLLVALATRPDGTARTATELAEISDRPKTGIEPTLF